MLLLIFWPVDNKAGPALISEKIHSAVKKVLSEGFATKDIAQKNSIIDLDRKHKEWGNELAS